MFLLFLLFYSHAMTNFSHPLSRNKNYLWKMRSEKTSHEQQRWKDRYPGYSVSDWLIHSQPMNKLGHHHRQIFWSMNWPNLPNAPIWSILTNTPSVENVRAEYAAVTETLFAETTENGYGVCSSQVLFAARSYFGGVAAARKAIVAEFARPNTNFKAADECYAVMKFASQFKLHLMVCEVTKCGSADLLEDHYALGFSNETQWFIMDVTLGTFVLRQLEKRVIDNNCLPEMTQWTLMGWKTFTFFDIISKGKSTPAFLLKSAL